MPIDTLCDSLYAKELASRLYQAKMQTGTQTESFGSSVAGTIGLTPDRPKEIPFQIERAGKALTVLSDELERLTDKLCPAVCPRQQDAQSASAPIPPFQSDLGRAISAIADALDGLTKRVQWLNNKAEV